MRYVAVVIAIVLASGSNTHADTFASKPGGYAIAFPGAPVHETREAVVKGAKVAVVFDSFLRESDEIFMVAYTDIPASAAGNPVDDASYVAQGTLIARKNLKVLGHPARDVEVALPQDHVLRLRIVDLGHRLYQIMVVLPTNMAHTASVDAYFASFRLTR